jgi:hypothetical protein
MLEFYLVDSLSVFFVNVMEIETDGEGNELIGVVVGSLKLAS